MSLKRKIGYHSESENDDMPQIVKMKVDDKVVQFLTFFQLFLSISLNLHKHL